MILLSIFALISLQSNANAGTTTADFLAWEREEQESFLQISISMITTVATQARPEIARCLNDWYYQGDGLQEKRHMEIIEIMPQYERFHPSTVVLAYVEEVCGRFDRG